MMRNVKARNGFTLIEFVVVIVVLSIVSAGLMKMMSNSAQIYVDATRRDQLASAGLVAVEKIARELRSALPNNIRATASCIEFIPVLAATNYKVPIAHAEVSSIAPVAFNSKRVSAGDRVIIYPVKANAAFDTSDSVSAEINNVNDIDSDPDVYTTDTITLTTAHEFDDDSPTKRLFIARGAVSYCIESAQLFRYSSYGFAAAQPSVGAFPGTPTRSLVADNIDAAGSAFTITPPTLLSNAIVGIKLNMAHASATSENVHIDHEVYIRNVP